jgi:putative ABC transport system permease protein
MAGRKLRIRLAWHQLRRDKSRLLTAVAGILFAATLMLLQLGFRDALFVAAIQLHERLKADLMLISAKYEFVATTPSYTERYLHRLAGLEEVEAVAPVLMGLVKWRNPLNHRQIPIFLVGMDPSATWLEVPGLQTNLDRIKLPDVVLFDVGSKMDYGPIPELMEAGKRVAVEIGGRQVQVGGLFSLGATWAADGNVFTSDLNFLRLMPARAQGLIDLGLIRLKPGADSRQALAAIRAMLPPDVQVMDRAEYMRFEVSYWAKRTPIGFIFNLGALVGFVVGAVIVYQILSTDIADHLGEYATLKAMGYSDRQLAWVVIQEALILAVLGFVPGWVLSTALGIFTRKMTMMPSYMTWERAGLVLFLTLVMCVGSAVLALRRLRAADPADIF